MQRFDVTLIMVDGTRWSSRLGLGSIMRVERELGCAIAKADSADGLRVLAEIAREVHRSNGVDESWEEFLLAIDDIDVQPVTVRPTSPATPGSTSQGSFIAPALPPPAGASSPTTA